MDETKRDQVEALLRAGDKPRARAILAEAIQKDAGDEFTWLALARALDDPTRQRDCLQRVLAINPANQAAAEWLEQLSGKAPLRAQSAAAPSIDTGSSAPLPAPVAPTGPARTPAPQPTVRLAPSALIRPTVASKPNTAWFWPTLAASLVIGLLVVSGVGIVAYQTFFPGLPASAPALAGPTSTPLRFPTLPPEWTATPVVPTATPRPVPTATLMLAATLAAGASTTPGSSPQLAHLNYPIAYVMVNPGAARMAYLTDGSSAGVALTATDQLDGWAPGGQGLYIENVDHRASYSINEVALDGSLLGPVVKLPAGANNAIISPDGRQVAFEYMSDPGLTARWNVDVMNVDGSQRQTIYHLPASDNALSLGEWSPDNQRIALAQQHCDQGPAGTSYLSCDAELYLINRDGTGWQQLTTGVWGAREPHWSPDGSEIVFWAGSPDEYHPMWGRVMLLRLDGSAPQPLVLAGYAEINMQQPDWSPDGKQIAFTGAKDRASIYIVPVNCFGAPQQCSWQDATRLPIQAQVVWTLKWKGSPPLSGAAAAPTIPAVTPLIPLVDNWVPVGSFSGQFTSRTALFTLASGTMRVSWKYTGPDGSKFAVALGRESTQEIETLDGTYGSGSGVFNHFNLFAGNDYFFIVEAMGTWSLDVSFNKTP